MENKEIIKNLVPLSIWNFFAELASLPRPSGHEEKVREWIKNFAEQRNLKYKTDEIGNIVIFKDAQNINSEITVLLQAHMDMVCEKDSSIDFDFLNDSIKFKLDNDYLYASGTTLGSDNGIGLCTILAILDDKTISHPKIQALFTVDEETGMSGVNNMENDFVNANYYLNFDSEEEGSVCIGSAGFRYITAVLQKEKELISDLSYFEICVDGLRGGHSGGNIHENRVNSIKLLSQVLFQTSLTYDFHLVSFNGGSLKNAIPRYATVKIAFDKSMAESAVHYINNLLQRVLGEYILVEPEIKIKSYESSPEKVWDMVFSKEVIRKLNSVYSGVMQMSTVVSGLTQTSNNLGVISSNKNEIVITNMTRSSEMTELQNSTIQILNSLCTQFPKFSEYVLDSAFIIEESEMKIIVDSPFSSWSPEKTDLLNKFIEVHKKITGKEPIITATHGGLECAVILQKMKNCKAISFGPQIDNAHSPVERVKISSVEEFYKVALEMLKELAR